MKAKDEIENTTKSSEDIRKNASHLDNRLSPALSKTLNSRQKMSIWFNP